MNIKEEIHALSDEMLEKLERLVVIPSIEGEPIEGKPFGEAPAKALEEGLRIADELGFFLWDVRFEKEGATWYLRVLIDKDGGIDMDDCEAFTRPMNKVLDEADPISQSYVLECGSPGLGRELRRPEHFEVCIGDVIRVRLIRPDENGEKEFVVGLVGYDKDKILCQKLDEDMNGVENVEFKLADCAYVKLNDDADLF